MLYETRYPTSKYKNKTKNKSLTPPPNPNRLLPPRIKHGADDQEAGGDGALAEAEDEAGGEEAAEGGAGGVCGEGGAPDEDVEAVGVGLG